MRAVIVCPDQHLVYDGRTPEVTGVGGGVTVRVRAAAALARRGVAVTLICNCPQAAEFDGVRYVPLAEVPPMEADVLLLHSSGGAVDVGPALQLPIRATVRVVMASGVSRIHGLEEAAPNAVYVPSNFLRRHFTKQWSVDPAKTFVTYHGVARRGGAKGVVRDPFRLIYPSHPAKGLHAALCVWRKLRARDARFQLEICGGDRLWGGTTESQPRPEAGLIYSGLLGQAALFERFQEASYVIQLQAVEEGFGISVAEGMAAGCVVLASPVGAYAETVRHGWNGLLVAGSHEAEETQERAARWILDLTSRRAAAERIRKNAIEFPLSWDVVAATWVGHWEWLLGGRAAVPDWSRCALCGGPALPLEDGFHCNRCGNYSQEIVPAK